MQIKMDEQSIGKSASPDANEAKRIIEAVLFAAGYPVKYNKLAEILSLSVDVVKRLTDDLETLYDGRGIMLVKYDNACQLCSREEYIEQIRAALGIRSGGNLSASALETLAIIAYKQPVTRAYIEQVRGADCSYAINTLVSKELVESKGRLDVPGRPNLYGTTSDFLRCFGLSSLDELPDSSFFKV